MVKVVQPEDLMEVDNIGGGDDLVLVTTRMMELWQWSALRWRLGSVMACTGRPWDGGGDLMGVLGREVVRNMGGDGRRMRC